MNKTVFNPAFTVSDRGFRYYDTAVDYDNLEFRVSESSLATQPCIRLTLMCDATDRPGLHLTEPQVRYLVKLLRFAINNHYQKRGGAK